METTAVIIGAGHAGLAMSKRLADRSIDHVVIERGEVANAWRTERWDSLRLLTPNWQSRLPGMTYQGNDPDGYMSAAEVATLITRYARLNEAPIRTRTTVRRVGATVGGFEVVTDKGRWNCQVVVLASGSCNRPVVPSAARSIPATIPVHTAFSYRRAHDLPEGPVLVIGASATGVQLADEIQRSGRPVTLSVGEHVRLPRTYRGRDIFWWTDAAGILDEGLDEIDDIVRARNLPSPQLIGSPEQRTVDLNSLSRLGVTVVGRLGRIVDGVAQFSGSLANTCALADLKMNRLLTRLDEWANDRKVGEIDRPHRFEPTRIDRRPALELDLVRRGIGSVVIATGFRPDYSWLDLPVLDRRGRLIHDGGAVAYPGLYTVGHNVLRRRRSSFISGADSDSAEVGELVHRYLDTRAGTRPPVMSPVDAGRVGR